MTEEVLAAQPELPDSSCGIVSRLLMRLGLGKDPKQASVIAVLFGVALTWLPSLLLCLASGSAFAGSVQVPFLGDYISSTRFLVVVPILILSDCVTRKWSLKTVKHFLHDHIAPSDAAKYRTIAANNFQLRDASGIALCLLLLALAYSPVWVDIVLAVHCTNWQVVSTAGHSVLSAAGQWNAYVSQPLFRFVLLDWLWGYLLWANLLFKVSRFPLKISATHPDCVGGLGFVAVGQSYFAFAAFAMSIGVCSFVAQTVLETHTNLQAYSNLGIVFVALVLLLFLGPLLVFTPLLVKTRREAVFTYGSLCHQVNSLFANTWLDFLRGNGQAVAPKLISSSEPSAVTDLNASFLNIQNMKPCAFGKETIVTFLAAVALPAIPLIATVIPLKDLLKELAKALT
ncbi:MAG: hypothetical protein Q8T09_04675 [Candidatus Melainabacteria bacterium]|jgi:hypothetical protein|nr:hypothetical protein [Candidatus Melainabacteria bacterium]